jgi:hypothetical protein
VADQQSLREWLDERRENALTIAAGEGVADPDAWREDAHYFRRAVEAVDKMDELRGLWLEWLGFGYDSSDLLRRVKLAVHGPLRKPDTAASTPQALSAPLKETVRMLTEDERLHCFEQHRRSNYPSAWEFDAAVMGTIQRKFCEVNAGRVIPASFNGNDK